MLEYAIVTLLTFVSIILERYLSQKKKVMFDDRRNEKIENIRDHVRGLVELNVIRVMDEYGEELKNNGLEDETLVQRLSDYVTDEIITQLPERTVEYIAQHLGDPKQWFNLQARKELEKQAE